MADPKLYNVDGGRDLAKEINAIVNRDRGISSASAPIVHTGFNSTNYIYTAKNVGTGGKVASWLTSAGATLLDAKDTGVTIGVNLTLPFMTQGSVIFAGAGGTLGQDNPNLFYDDTNNRLGIGTATPLTRLHVVGAANITDVIRAQGNVGTGMTGPGIELQHNGTTAGAVLSYNRSSTTYLDLDMAGKIVTLSAGASPKVTVGATTVGIDSSVIISGGLTVDTTTFKVDNSTDRVGVGLASPQSLLEVAGACRITNNGGTATTGAGLEMLFNTSGNNGYIFAGDRSAGSIITNFIDGNPLYLLSADTLKLAFYGFGTGVTRQAIGATATTSSAVLTRLNALCDALINTGIVKS